MVERYRYIHGSELLIIFQKYLEFKESSAFKWISNLIETLFDTNLEAFIIKQESGEVNLYANPDLNKYFAYVKRNYFENKIKEH